MLNQITHYRAAVDFSQLSKIAHDSKVRTFEKAPNQKVRLHSHKLIAAVAVPKAKLLPDVQLFRYGGTFIFYLGFS